MYMYIHVYTYIYIYIHIQALIFFCWFYREPTLEVLGWMHFVASVVASLGLICMLCCNRRLRERHGLTLPFSGRPEAPPLFVVYLALSLCFSLSLSIYIYI